MRYVSTSLAYWLALLIICKRASAQCVGNSGFVCTKPVSGVAWNNIVGPGSYNIPTGYDAAHNVVYSTQTSYSGGLGPLASPVSMMKVAGRLRMLT